MIDLFRAGNLYFTVPLALVAIAIIALSLRAAGRAAKDEHHAFESGAIFHLGLFAFVFGLLSQAIGLYQMMGAIEQVGSVSPALVAGGLKVSFIAPVFGLIVFVTALSMRLGLDLWSSRGRRDDARAAANS